MRAFFQRQFASEMSSAQITLDVILGIVAPVVCVAVDLFGLGGLVANLPIVSYATIVLGISTLALWLLLNRHIKSFWSGLTAGVLLSGTLYASLTGVALLYFTCWGLLSGIMTTIEDGSIEGTTLAAMSLLGFVPFFTAFVFLRNGLRALQQARTQTGRSQLIISLFLGTIIVLLFIVLVPK